MRSFLINIFIFSAIILCLLIPSEIYVEGMPNPARYKHEWMRQHSEEVQTLILGSSHTYYGISPDSLGEGAFSLALVSQTYQYDLYLLKHYSMPRLRTLILPFSYFSMWEDESNMYPPDISRYRIYMDCDNHSRWSEYGFEFFNTKAFVEKLKSLYTPPTETWSERGWGTNYTFESRPDPWDNGAERAKNNTYTDTTVVSANRIYLSSIFRFCRENGVKVILVTTPVSSTFLESEAPRQVAINNEERDRLLAIYPEVLYLNLESDSRFHDEHFHDADHLDTDGARLLTSLLSEYCSSE